MAHERQHWIPESYLSAWCDTDPTRLNPRRVHRYRRDGSYRDYRPPSRIFTEHELYTIRGVNGQRDLTTEHALTLLEDAYVRIRDRTLAKRQALSDKKRDQLFLFIASLRARSPAQRDHHADFRASVLRVGDELKAALKDMTPEQRKRAHLPYLTRNGPPGIPLEKFRELANRSFGEHLPQDVNMEARLMSRMHLSVLFAQSDMETFITSDRPVVWWDPTDPPPSQWPLGLGRRAIEVTMPLTPTMCARITHWRTSEYANASASDVNEVNMRTLYHCKDVFLSERPNLSVNWRERS